MSTNALVGSPTRTGGVLPGGPWVWARRLCQAFAFVAILAAPLLGGWQRLDRNFLATWDGGWDLPDALIGVLPLGEAPHTAYEANRLMGGGVAVSYLDLPAVDPVAGTVALLGGNLSVCTLVAWGLPVLLGVFFGRVFCGWFCPFGVLSRAVLRLSLRLPGGLRGFALPQRRPVRFAVLGLAVLLGVLGSQLLLTLTLPHLLVQQSVYFMWLLGGGGAALGALLALLAAGVLFGPTLYCAAVCPTGASLALLGRARRVSVAVAAPSTCGTRCNLCDGACWLGLTPSGGDAGPDCNLCARCFTACPKTNLRVFPKSTHALRVLPSLLLVAVVATSGEARAAGAGRGQQRIKPRLVLDATHEADDLTLAVSLVDLSGVRLAADSPESLSGVEVTAFMARGAAPPPDALGRQSPRQVYRGPLTVVLETVEGQPRQRFAFDAPNSPLSTPNRNLYRQRADVRVEPGDRIVVEPVADWLPEPVTWTLRAADAGVSTTRLLVAGVAAGLLFVGLSLLALAFGGRRAQGTGARVVASVARLP